MLTLLLFATFYIIRTVGAHGIPVLPGALTLTEIWTSANAGAEFVKVFPAGAVGPRYFRKLRGPFAQIPFMASGGVNLENAAEFIKFGVDALGLGGGPKSAMTHLERECSRRFVGRASMSVESRSATQRRLASCLKNRVRQYYTRFLLSAPIGGGGGAAVKTILIGFQVGDRVAVDPNIACRTCEYCLGAISKKTKSPFLGCLPVAK
jgi:KDPG and KHG aldolase